MSSTVEGRPVATARSTADGDLSVVHEPAAPAADPAMIGVPAFVVGAVALGLGLVGFVPPTASAGALPIILAATGVGQLMAAGWAARLGQSAVASIFAIFAGFWLSYALLVLGLTHGWYGIATADAPRTVTAYLLTWVVLVALLTVVTMRLPLAFTVLFVLVEVALVLVMLGNELTSPGLSQAGGWVVFSFAALGGYLFAGSASVATGGPALPLGRPVLR